MYEQPAQSTMQPGFLKYGEQLSRLKLGKAKQGFCFVTPLTCCSPTQQLRRLRSQAGGTTAAPATSPRCGSRPPHNDSACAMRGKYGGRGPRHTSY